MRLSIKAAGVAVGLFLSSVLVIMSAMCALTGQAGSQGATGFGAPLLRDIMSVCPCARLTVAGTVIGAAWLFIYGFVATVVVVFLYNMLAGSDNKKKNTEKKDSHGIFLNV